MPVSVQVIGFSNAANANSPINTYSNKGTAKPGVIKANHAIIYNHDSTPRTSDDERPAIGERGMLSPIRVRGCLQSDRCHPMARINFARTYTVEHNVKVYHFGNVLKDDLSVLMEQWQRVLQAEAARAIQGQSTPARGQAGEGRGWEQRHQGTQYGGNQ